MKVFSHHALASLARHSLTGSNPLLRTSHTGRGVVIPRFWQLSNTQVSGKPFSSFYRAYRRNEAGVTQIGSEIVGGGGEGKRKARQSAGGKTSLRRVAVEAERSRRDFIKGKGKNRFVDPGAYTKKVTAYCAAEQYSISMVARLARKHGFEVDPFNTGLYPQVVHVQPGRGSNLSSLPSSQGAAGEAGDIFIFPSGTVVTWDVPERMAQHLVADVLPPAAKNPHLHLLETEDLGYLEDPTTHTSSVLGDTIVLGTGPQLHPTAYGTTNSEESPAADDGVETKSARDHAVETVLAKIAFSSGLARSTKLSVLETLLSGYFESTREIPTMLSRGSRLPFTRSFILRKTGELLSIRAQLNLYSELTDSLPDLFWDSRHELGLEGYYDEVGRALDVGVRIRVLNEKMDYAQEIASVLRERMSERHGLLLEWLIIALISVEVMLEFWRHWKEKEERLDPMSTESLLRRYLRSRDVREEPGTARGT